MKIEFFVAGKAAPGGSKKGYIRGGKVAMVDAGKGNKEWRNRVADRAREVYDGDPLTGPLVVTMVFTVARPKDHYRTGRHRDDLRPGAPEHPTVKPDVLKLGRAAEDAMTGIIWRDDAATIYLSLGKRYGCLPGVAVTIETIDETGRTE